jgi:hypothetical protein
LHEFFKRKLPPPRFVTIRGEEMQLPGSTTDLSKGEMVNFMDRICALTNIPIPDPAAAGFYQQH